MKAIEEINKAREHCGDLQFSLVEGGSLDNQDILDYIKTLHDNFPALRDRIRELEEVVKQKDVTVRKFRLEIRELENEVSALSITNKTLASNAIQPNDQSKKIERLRIEKGELEEKVEDGRVRIEELERVKQTAVDDAACYLDEARRRRYEGNKLERENHQLKKQVGLLEEKNRTLFDTAMEFAAKISDSGAVREEGE